MLTAFFRMHDIPVGPELFLREWGVSWRHPFPRKARDHKRELIGNMLALYPDLPFVLVGDSGQHDPEVYADVVREHPGRVRAVYIRNVSPAPSRAAEIEELARAVTAAGSALVLASDTVAMAEHAAAQGLVGPGTIDEVARERAVDGEQHRSVTVRAKRDEASTAALATSGGNGRPRTSSSKGAMHGTPDPGGDLIEGDERTSPPLGTLLGPISRPSSPTPFC